MTSAKEEVSRRASARRDPRAEPDSIPAMAAVRGQEPSTAEAGGIVEEVVPSSHRDPRVDPESEPPEPARSRDEAAAPPVDGEPRPAQGPPIDPRFAELEPLFARNAWAEIAERLGPPDKIADLPPALALVLALAQREAAGEGSAAGATELAIKSMAALLGVPATSDTALVLAKRLLRQNPAGWRTKPAPPARVSVPIIILGLALGAAVGWFASLGSLHFF